MSAHDAVIVGGGVAGASVAWWLRRRGIADVVILEHEATPAYHSTGRSAAVLEELELDEQVQPVLAEAARFFRDPPPGFEPLLDPSGLVLLFDEPEWSAVRAAIPRFRANGTRIDVLDAVPGIAREAYDGAVSLPDDGRLDVPALMRGYLRGARVQCGAEVTAVLVDDGRAVGVDTSAGRFDAPCVVNAAGAWAGELARLAGATPIPITAYRRTIVNFAGDPAAAVPMICFESRRLYYTTEGGGLIASPMDEDEVPPCDAAPDPAVMEATVDRLRALAPHVAPATITGSRAGLRSFAPDRRFVLGEDAALPGFFWLAGQGGWGIETSPTLGRIVADAIVDGAPVEPAFSPARFG